MEESLRSNLLEIGQETDDLMDQVENALEEHAAFSFMLATRQKVEAVSRRYRELRAGLGEKDQFDADRTVGRKVADLQKAATKLPTLLAGKPAEKPVDSGFFETRAPKSSRPPVTIGLQPGEKRRERDAKQKTGDEIEAWCGRCMSLRDHIIAAMVGDQPAQVVCQFCGSRSRFREGPRKKTETTRTTTPTASKPGTAGRARDEKDKEHRELVDALRNAEHVRPFSPKERYKAGEIIDHPEHGRGKIENTLPRSLLVRFAGGLKPLKLS